MVSADRLASFYQVAFDHDAFDKPADIFIDPAAVQDLFYNADLLFILFAGIRMIGIDEDRRVLQISLFIFFQKELDILIVVVGDRVSVLVYSAPEDRVGEGVAFRAYFPASGDKVVPALCGNDRVEHDREVSAGGILHAHGDVQAADHEAVLLILHGACSDGHIGEDIGEIVPVVRVEHLIRSGKPGL